MSIKRLLEKDFYESKEFERFAESLFEFEEINGKKLITKKSMNHIINLDPMDIIEIFTGEKINDNSIGMALVLLHLKKGLESYIAKNISDISSSYNASLEQYLDIFKSYGFEVVQKNEKYITTKGSFSDEKGLNSYFEKLKNKCDCKIESKEDKGNIIEVVYSRKELDLILYSKNNNLLIHLDTHYGNINGLNVYFNGYVRDKIIANVVAELGYSGGYIQGTNIISGYIDLREFPSKKIDTLLSVLHLEKYFISYDPYLKSYIDEDMSNKEATIDKTLRLPEEIKERLLKFNTDLDFIERLKKEDPNIKSDIDIHQDFINKYILKDIDKLSLKDKILDFMMNPLLLIEDNFRKKPEFQFLNENVLSVLIFNKIRENKNNIERKYNKDDLLKTISQFTAKEKEVLLKELDRKYCSIKYIIKDVTQIDDFIKELKEKLTSELKIDKKVSKKLH